MPRRSSPAMICASARVTAWHAAYSAAINGARASGTSRQDSRDPVVSDTTAS